MFKGISAMKKHITAFLFLILLLCLSVQTGAVTIPVPGGLPQKAALIPMEVIRNTKDLLVSQTGNGKATYYLSADDAGSVYFYDPVRNIYVYNGRRQEVILKDFSAYGWAFSKNLSDTLHGSTPGASGQTGYEQTVLMNNLAQVYDFYEEVLGLDGFNGCGGVFYAVADVFYSDKDFHREQGGGIKEWLVKVVDRTVSDFDQGISYMAVPETALTVFYAGTNKFYKSDLESWESRAFVAHEYTHAVFNAALYAGMYGASSRADDHAKPSALLKAVNESYADIFSQLINAYYDEKDPSWIFADDVGVDRNMKEKTEGFLYHVNDFHDSEEHAASTILSHAMYLTWNAWRAQSLSIDECVRDMAYLLYRAAGEIPADCSFDTLGRLLGSTAWNMKAQGMLTPDQITGLKEGLEAVGIPYYDVASNSINLHSDYEIWKRCLAETAVSVMEIGQQENTSWELTPQSRELAMARIASFYGRDQADFYDKHNEETGEGFEYWEKTDNELHMNPMTLFMYESWLFGNDTPINDLVLDDPNSLHYFRVVPAKENSETEVLLPLNSVSTARSAGWTCNVNAIQRNRDSITLQGVIKNKDTEKEFYANFERTPSHLDGAFFYGFHLKWLQVFDQTLNEEDVFEIERIKLPAKKTDPEDDLLAYVTNTLLPLRGQLGPDSLFSNAEAMYPITEWTAKDLDGILGWAIADFDADGTKELLVADLHEGQTLELMIYEPGESAGSDALMSVSMKLQVPMSYLTMWNLQTNCFYYSQGEGRPFIAIDTHYTIMESVSTLLLYQYNGTEFEFCHGFGYHEQGEGDVYLYDVQTEPASPFALNCASYLFEEDAGWELKNRYMAEDHDWTLLSKEDEKRDFYAPYEQAVSNYGLIVNDTRLWALQEEWDGTGDYSEYHNRYSRIWTADVYTPSDAASGDALTFVGGLNLFYVMNGQSYLQFVS